MRTLAVCLLFTAACQSNVKTPFPPGLEPLEDNMLSSDGSLQEGLRTASSSSPYVKIYGRGYVQAPFDAVWQAIGNPDADIAICSTTEHQVTVDNDPAYEHSFLVHYIVRSVLTVEWDDQWRFGLVPELDLGMVKHQKVQGSSFITLSEGTIQVLRTTDPNVSELSFVEHLDAVSAGVADVLKGVQHNYDSIVAVSHGNPVPACP